MFVRAPVEHSALSVRERLSVGQCRGPVSLSMCVCVCVREDRGLIVFVSLGLSPRFI